MSAAPDYATAILAWRSWVAVESRDGIRLCGSVYRTLWQPREALAARCHVTRPVKWRPWRHVRLDHEPPQESCRCGIYGARRLDAVVSYVGGLEPLAWRLRARVLGLVQLWGDVVEHEGGWRSSHAYPAALFGVSASPEVVAALGAYGVPVGVVEGRGDALVAALRARGEPVELR